MDGGPSWTDVVTAITAVVVAGFTGVLTWVGVVQARLLKRSTAMSRTALHAANQSATAAVRAAEVAEANLVVLARARVHFDRPSTLYLPNAPTADHVIGLVHFV